MIVAQRLAKLARVEMVVVFLPFLCTKVRISVASLVAGMRGHSGGEQSPGQKKYIIGNSYIVGNVYTIRFRNR